MVTIPAGTFQMGCVSGKHCEDDELPVRTVTFDKSFAIGKYEVTFAEYDNFAEANGSEKPNDEGWGRGKRPVINVSREDAQAYASWLSEQTGKRYRLPTEAEWEYACRAGTKTLWSFGNNKADLETYAWYSHPFRFGGVKSETYTVGEKRPNPWGLYDMHGNVGEWMADCWHKNYEGAPTDGSGWHKEGGGDCGLRVLRGGSWNHTPENLRSAYRGWNFAVSRHSTIGFRLAQHL